MNFFIAFFFENVFLLKENLGPWRFVIICVNYIYSRGVLHRTRSCFYFINAELILFAQKWLLIKGYLKTIAEQTTDKTFTFPQ